MVEPITVACEHCRSKLKLKSAAAVGKKIACPKCKKVFTVRAPAEKKNDEEHLFDDLPLDDYPISEEEQEEEEEKAAKKVAKTAAKKKAKRKEADSGSLLMIALLLLVGVGVIGGGAYAFLNFMPGGGGITVYMPVETDMVIHARVADFAASPLMSPLLADPKVKEAIDKGVQKTGMGLPDIESVTVGFVGVMANMKPQQVGPPRIGPTPNQPFVAVVKTKAPIDMEKIKTNLQTQVTPANHNGQEYFTATMGGQIFGYFRPNEKTLVFGPEGSLKGAIDSKGASPAGSRYKFVDLSQHLVFAFGPKEISQFRTNMGMVFLTENPETKQLEPQKDDLVYGMSTGLTATSDLIVRHDIRYNSSSTAKNPTTIEASKTDMENTKDKLGEAKLQVSLFTLTMPTLSGPVNRIFDHLNRALSSATVTPSGATLTTQVTIPGAIVNDFKELATVATGLMPPGGGGMGTLPLPGMTSPGLPQAGSANPGLPEGLTLPPDPAAAAAAAAAATPTSAAPPTSATPPATSVPAGPAAPPP